MPAGGRIERKHHKPVVTIAGGPGGSKTKTYSWQAQPGCMVLACWFDAIVFAVNFSVDGAIAHVIAGFLTSLPIVYTVQGLIRIRRDTQRLALQQAKSQPIAAGASPDDQQHVDVSSGSWLTWQPAVMAAMIAMIPATFFFLVCVILALAGSINTAQNIIMVVTGSIILLCAAFFYAGRRKTVGVGATNVVGPGLWTALNVVAAALLFGVVFGPFFAFISVVEGLGGHFYPGLLFGGILMTGLGFGAIKALPFLKAKSDEAMNPAQPPPPVPPSEHAAPG